MTDHVLEKENSVKKNIKRFFKNRKYELKIPDEVNEIVEQKKLNSNHTYAELDSIFKKNMKDLTTKVDDEALKGFKKKFPFN